MHICTKGQPVRPAAVCVTIGIVDVVGDYIMATGDMIHVTMTPPTIVPQLMAPIPLTGTSTVVKVMGKPACLQGDELPPAIAGPMPYMAGPYSIPGVGTLKIMLLPNNLTMASKNSKPLLIKGSTFQVQFQVMTPAQTPPPASTPDPMVMKPGTAQFITTNIVVKGG
jgi:hypothetical protein